MEQSTLHVWYVYTYATAAEEQFGLIRQQVMLKYEIVELVVDLKGSNFELLKTV